MPLKPGARLVPVPRPDRPDRPLTIPACRVRPRGVEWIWEPYVPAGMLTLLAGRPGEGKSTIAVDLAARVSRGGGSVLFVSGEDDRARVLRPRLEAAGADLDRVSFLEVELDLPDGIEVLRRAIQEIRAALVVLDPINAFIALKVNAHRDHHVRRVLGPLSELTEETGAAVLVVSHLNKAPGEDPLMRVGGSVAYVAAARQVLVAASDPGDEGRRVLAPVKANVAELGPALAYRIEGVETDGGIRTSRVAWLGEAPEVDVRALLAPPAREERTLAAEAAAVLREILAEGERPARQVERELREALGVELSRDTMRRARELARVVTRKVGFEGGWYWTLAEGTSEGTTPNPSPVVPSARPGETGSPRPEGTTGAKVRIFVPSAPSAADVLGLARALGWPRLERPDGCVVEDLEAWEALVAAFGPDVLAGLWDHLEGVEAVRAALDAEPAPPAAAGDTSTRDAVLEAARARGWPRVRVGPVVIAGGEDAWRAALCHPARSRLRRLGAALEGRALPKRCPCCDARSPEPGYGGHGMRCPRRRPRRARATGMR